MPPSRDSYADNFPKPEANIDTSGLELSPTEAEDLRQQYAVSPEATRVAEPMSAETQTFGAAEAPILTPEELKLRQEADIEELFGDGFKPSSEAMRNIEPVPANNLDVPDHNDPEVAEALEYIGSSSNQSYSDILRAWKDKMYSNNQSAKKYGYGGLVGGGATLGSGIAASALGYTAVGTGLAFGAPAVILGGGALWAGKKIYNKWKGRRVAEKLKLYPEDLKG